MQPLPYKNSWTSRSRMVIGPPRIVFGVTDSQTCLTLTGRIRAFREAGFRVVVVCSPGELLQRIARDEGAEAVEIAMRRRISPLADAAALIRLFRLLCRFSPDVTEFSTPKAGLLGNLAAWLCGVPVRIYFLRGLKLESCSGLKRRLLQASERVAAGCAHTVLCNSPSLRAAAIRLRLADASKLQILGSGSSNGVDVRRFAPCAPGMRLQESCQAPVIGFVGRLTRDKGVPELIAAFDRILEEMPEARLLLVGWFDASEDSLDRLLQARILRDPRIRYTGFVRDTAPCYGRMDLLALPSWREGFPNAVLEAAASGVPVVVTNSTGCCDAVIPGRTGLLIPPGDPDLLSAAILELLRDPDRRQRMGRQARAWILDHFVDKHVLGMAVSYYRSLLVRAANQRLAKGGEAGAEKAQPAAAVVVWETAGREPQLQTGVVTEQVSAYR